MEGFTLVELLIVVSIIGVLATIGIPSYRKMVQKARQGEAKTVLGAIYKAEVAFFAEYGQYGNRIGKIGVELTGSDFHYLAGSYVADCAKPTGDMPLFGGPEGVKLNSEWPDYYNPPYASSTIADYAVGRTTFLRCTFPGGLLPFISSAPPSFQLFAQGVISPSYDRNFPIDLSAVDIWMINDEGVLSNVQLGIR